jgi:hypothetical protein
VIDAALGGGWETIGEAIKESGAEDSSGLRRCLANFMAEGRIADAARVLKCGEDKIRQLHAKLFKEEEKPKMKLIRKGNLKERVWGGSCRECNSEFEALEKELDITHDQRDGSFAHADCPECGAKAGSAVILYLKKK